MCLCFVVQKVDHEKGPAAQSGAETCQSTASQRTPPTCPHASVLV